MTELSEALGSSAACGVGPRRRRLHVTTLHGIRYVSASRQPRTSREKVQAHRDRLRKQGLRPIQIWVPDVRSPAFKAAAHRQSRAVAKSRSAKRDQIFIDAISDLAL